MTKKDLIDCIKDRFMHNCNFENLKWQNSGKRFILRDSIGFWGLDLCNQHFPAWAYSEDHQHIPGNIVIVFPTAIRRYACLTDWLYKYMKHTNREFKQYSDLILRAAQLDLPDGEFIFYPEESVDSIYSKADSMISLSIELIKFLHANRFTLQSYYNTEIKSFMNGISPNGFCHCGWLGVLVSLMGCRIVDPDYYPIAKEWGMEMFAEFEKQDEPDYIYRFKPIMSDIFHDLETFNTLQYDPITGAKLGK